MTRGRASEAVSGEASLVPSCAECPVVAMRPVGWKILDRARGPCFVRSEEARGTETGRGIVSSVDDEVVWCGSYSWSGAYKGAGRETVTATVTVTEAATATESKSVNEPRIAFAAVRVSSPLHQRLGVSASVRPPLSSSSARRAFDTRCAALQGFHRPPLWPWPTIPRVPWQTSRRCSCP